MAKRLENVARNAGTHAAGVVISQKPLTEYVPLQHPPRGEESLVTQYSMNYLDNIGLLKVDILGLSNLTIIKNALRIIRKISDEKIALENFPLDDKKTFELLSRGETSGVFQLESDGMKRYLKELKPTTFEDILSMVALYRPGPMDSVADFIASKHGRKKITYLDPKLEPILKPTYGVIVTQDQVLQIARHFAGFTYGEADILRKAVGKKIKGLLDEQKEKFLSGAVKTGSDQKTAKSVWDFIEPFARYGFNRAHAACYAMIAYQTAYLKAHYPSAFMAAWLTAEQQNIDKVAFAIAETKRMGIKILPPDVNESFVEFGVMKDSSTGSGQAGDIRFGLAAIKNVGAGVSEAIAEERKNGKFANLEDFLLRLGTKILNKKVIEALAKAGALDCFADRAALISGLDMIIKYLGDTSKNGAENQPDLFGNLSKKPEIGKLVLSETQEISRKEKLAWEKELLGMYVSEHPLSGIEGVLAKEGRPISEISIREVEKKVKIAGIISAVKKIVTKSNEPMVFATVEDTSNKIEVLVFPKILKQNPNLWQADTLIVLSGRVNNKDGNLKIIVEEGKPLSSNDGSDLIDSPPMPTKLVIELPSTTTKDTLLKLKVTLGEFPGELPVYLRLLRTSGVQEIKAKNAVSDNPELIAKLRAISGSKITLS
jgi:DNA polymerase-3 subunit alpha